MSLQLLLCAFIAALVLHRQLDLRDSWLFLLLLWLVVHYLMLFVRHHLFAYPSDEDDRLSPDVDTTLPPPPPQPGPVEEPTMKTSPTFVRVRETIKAVPTKAVTNDTKYGRRNKTVKTFRYDMLRRTEKMALGIQYMRDEVDFQRRFRAQQYRRLVVVESLPEADQQQQPCLALIPYQPPRKYTWDFSAAIRSADSVRDWAPVMSCFKIKALVMRFEEILQGRRSLNLVGSILPLKTVAEYRAVSLDGARYNPAVAAEEISAGDGSVIESDGECSQPLDPIDEDYLRGTRRTRDPVEGDTEGSCAEPRLRKRLNSQLPGRLSKKSDYAGYAATNTEYSILDWGHHSQAEMFSWIFAPGAVWD
ncbi:hypothetical protein G6011_05928 [Alternaria panax]|uniref:Uncharacterized protein n=1 Tax=Alternaria panax TaxID=48097 RepID=A0AAD4I504_9PLEO|nr:hypothetical protein G6011_05928 [Alternaria panax]